MLALKSGQPIDSLLDLIHRDRRVFDSLWYMSFPPEDATTDVDAVLSGKM